MCVRVVNKEVNPAFEDFIFDWNHTTYFSVGGYGASKSYHAGLKVILKCLEEKRKVLVVREVYATMRDSVYSLLLDILADLNLLSVVKNVKSPLSIQFPNGSEILFRGLDDVEKLKSINNVSLIWIEEASEIKYEGYKELLGRARHPRLKIHFILTTNPVSKRNWVYKHFFINKDRKKIVLNDRELYDKKTIVKNDVYYHHSTVDDNMFLPKSYIDTLDDIRNYDPDLYRVARKGEFGTNGTKVLPAFEISKHADVMQDINRLKMKRTGMDFGFQTSYNAVIRIAINHEKKWLYIYKEYYKRKMTDLETANDKDFKEFKLDYIRADHAEPKAIKFFNLMGYRMAGASKYTRLEQIKRIRRFKRIICSDECKNTIDELKDLTFAVDKNGEIIEDKLSIDAHTLDAIFYALDDYDVADLKGDALRSISRSEILGY